MLCLRQLEVPEAVSIAKEEGEGGGAAPIRLVIEVRPAAVAAVVEWAEQPKAWAVLGVTRLCSANWVWDRRQQQGGVLPVPVRVLPYRDAGGSRLRDQG